ncbi:secreted protein [Candidatus Thiomargarita nelsonii]|uniref:Secreted protein n=1 Tax=Candidatus Thiomargarita nelsonii TaxID=1003181 RepID=A0A176S1T2_9GAMM|nr:secreted protein [Candidatus Thiomargarita nelsonii]
MTLAQLVLSVIISTAVFGEPNTTSPVTLFKLMMRISLFSGSSSSMSCTVKVLSVASPSAQFRVPLVAI